MRKSLIMGTREDVIKRRSKQATAMPVHSGTGSESSISSNKRTIVTYNHPSIKD